MLTMVKSLSLHGLDGYEVIVEVDMAGGMPQWEMVGLPDIAVKESRERVRTSLKNSDLEIPPKRIVINLAPANTKKEGPFFDLPIAIGILGSLGIVSSDELSKHAFIGELSLDGNLKSVTGILPITIAALNIGFKNIIIPYDNLQEAGVVKGINILPAKNIKEVVAHLNADKPIEPIDIDVESLFSNQDSYDLDFSDVKGQEMVKRALEVSASGAHNCIMIGSPGSGKTMMAKRLPSILPDMTFEEALEVTKIHSIAGILSANTSLITKRPFRAPHHTISAVALAGGGKIPKPGEISLSHYGVLFLDELPEFQKNSLEVLRQPLEDGVVNISRVNASLTYPAKCMWISSLNPCPCGLLLEGSNACKCTPAQIHNYMAKISGPLLDRIDLHIEVPTVRFRDLENPKVEESSETIKARVNKARKIQLERYKNLKIYSNSQLPPSLIEKYCRLEEKSKTLLRNAFEKLGLSARAHNRILKVARTIADMAESENILSEHIGEAIQYRSLDRKFWA